MAKTPFRSKSHFTAEEIDRIVNFQAPKEEVTFPSEDALTLNDNINYHLHFEAGSSPKSDTVVETSSIINQNETSLSSGSLTLPKTANKSRRSPFFTKSRTQNRSKDDTANRDQPKYQRFSQNRRCSVTYSSDAVMIIFLALLVIFFCALIGWIVTSTINDSNRWREEHYKKVWERAHNSFPQAPDAYYHDHNNLSTKNKANATENAKLRKTDKIKSTTMHAQIVNPSMCGSFHDDERLECYPQEGASLEKCQSRGCCWSAPKMKDHNPNTPYCFYPSNYANYKLHNHTESVYGATMIYEKVKDSSYPNDFNFIKVEVKYYTDSIFQVKISDLENDRFEPPYPEIPTGPVVVNELMYSFVMNPHDGTFKIIRKSDGISMFEPTNIGMILSNKFLQYTLRLPAASYYGLGERRGSFMLDLNRKTRSIFNFDHVPDDNVNGYGSHPFFMGHDKSGRSFGLLLLNSNPMDVTLQSTPSITYRTIGGILNFYGFVGPSPGEVISQYTNLIGFPFMPPYWSLGFHLCKFGYGSLGETEAVWNRTRAAEIPFDVQWNDLDYMYRKNDFSYDQKKFSGLPKFVKKLHSNGMHYIPLIDPSIASCEKAGTYKPYDLGLEMDVFIKNRTGQPFIGVLWNECAENVWPDFTHPNATEYWVQMFADMHKMFPYDGAWIDMNEPSNFLSGPKYGNCLPEEYPYIPKIAGENGLNTKTICMDAKQYAGEHFDLHNLYALTEAITTNFALTEVRGKRPFVISRSSFIGLGHYAGHWSGDIASEWNDMRKTIPELLSFSLFGIPMMGADICGFQGDTTVELCKRWMQLGAFYPFSRNHNCDTCKPQDPVILGKDVADASREALRMRYAFLPYLYGLFHRAHMHGETVVRPMFFEYPTDENTFDIDTQFMWGPHVLISPILDPNTVTTKAYIPFGIWYTFKELKPLQNGHFNVVEIGEDDSVLIRGGAIIPLHTLPSSGPITTQLCRSEPVHLLVALNETFEAEGFLFWDDGDSLNSYVEHQYTLIEFASYDNVLRSHVVYWGYGVPVLGKVTILGVKHKPNRVTNNGKLIPFQYIDVDMKLILDNLKIKLNGDFQFDW